MSKPRSQAPRASRGTAAGGGNPGTNTSAADRAAKADVSESAGALAPANPPVSEGSPHASEGNARPAGAESDGAPSNADIPVALDFAEQAGGAIPASGMLAVRACSPAGMRRAGRYWSGTDVTEVPVSDFTEEQLERLLTEPLLKVTTVIVPLEDAP